jgi:hypothetical protein
MSDSPQLLVLGAIGEVLRILTKLRHLLAGVLLLVFAASAVAEVCPNPQGPKAQRDQADQLPVLSTAEQADAIQTIVELPNRLLPVSSEPLCEE